MGEVYVFQDEDGEIYRVEYTILDTEQAVRRYGIRARLYRNGRFADETEVRERFLTQVEAEETMKMLRRFQVTPCTLQDVI